MDRMTLVIRRAYYRRKFGKEDGEKCMQKDLELEAEGQALRDAQAEFMRKRESAVRGITQKNRLIGIEKVLQEELQKLRADGHSEKQIAEAESRLAEISSEKELACQRVELSKEEIKLEEAVLRKSMEAFKKRKEAIQGPDSS